MVVAQSNNRTELPLQKKVDLNPKIHKLYHGCHDLSSITTPRPEGVVIDDKPWQPWYKCNISYLIG